MNGIFNSDALPNQRWSRAAQEPEGIRISKAFLARHYSKLMLIHISYINVMLAREKPTSAQSIIDLIYFYVLFISHTGGAR